MDAADEKALRKKVREQHKALADLVSCVEQFLKLLDQEMKKPSSLERGRKIAQLATALEIAKDSARFGALGIDFRTGKKRVG